nr:type II toxin-antitoxin system VapC family toxin [Chlorobaculum limnaeum]
MGFEKIEELEAALAKSGLQMLDIPKEALFLAGKAFLNYRKHKGEKRSPLPDFFIGAHAAVSGLELITRDKNRYQTYFPTFRIIAPE